MRMKELVAGGLVSLVLAGCGYEDYYYCGEKDFPTSMPIIIGERPVIRQFLTTSSSTTTGCSYSGLEEYKKNQ